MSKSFTEEDVQLGIDAIARVWNDRAGLPADAGTTLAQSTWGRDVAAAVLAALAEAGRILPAAPERQWAYESTANITVPISAHDVLRYQGIIAARKADGHDAGRVLWRALGVWVEADGTE